MRKAALLLGLLLAQGCASPLTSGGNSQRNPSIGPFDEATVFSSPVSSKSDQMRNAVVQCRKDHPRERGSDIVSRASCISTRSLEIYRGDPAYDLLVVLARERVVLAEQVAAKRLSKAEAELEFAKLSSQMKDRAAARTKTAQ